MSKSQGFVSSISEDGWAEVVFHTSDPGMAGASGSRTCHCSGGRGSARLAIKALNKAGSGVGDLVSVDRTPGALVRIAGTLFGIPAIGLILGIVVGVLLSQNLAVNEAGAVIVAMAGLLLGIIIAVARYRKMSADDQLTPVITRVIRTAAKGVSSSMAIDPVCKMQVNPATAAASFDYQNRTYYFCAPGCQDAFAQDPSMYL